MCKSSWTTTLCDKCRNIVSREKHIDIQCVWKYQIERAQQNGSNEHVEELKALCKQHAIEGGGQYIRVYGCQYCDR
ncbi:hypothetical protein CY34DRAFT_532214 [Suillus luteus UH-Slu-Lm8-n1]|uniref:Uncharacterized protein n=1 Tax=Suillus luteus UH-Slu-Lm8-n1 TaxID=930992 RepID=A0A0D0A3H5_9AGAM|nr:hypothetical protein CY34DRAFT_532214 [Suillus luteus UH-Slu-Lm8-n1]